MTLSDQPPTASTPIVARRDRMYFLKQLGIFILFFGWGIYSCYDGFYHYPRENADAERRGLKALPHPGFDVPFNVTFGIALPPLAILFLARQLYVSRGRLTFDGHTLGVPGHPPIPLDTIEQIDRTKWDRKGIAFLAYRVGDTAGRAKLDDFVYERTPTDAIFKSIETALVPAEAITDPGAATDTGNEASPGQLG